MFRSFLDDATSKLSKLSLSSLLAQKIVPLMGEKKKESPNRMTVLSLTRSMVDILSQLGAMTAKAVEVVAGAAKFFPQEQRRTKGARQKDNDAALALMAKLRSEGREATDQERAVLARFSGYGGGLVDPEGKEGSPYEYYTPTPVAAGTWELLKGLGFAGGKVLDPCAGSGVFAATRPDNAVIDQVELSSLSGGVNALVNAGPGVTTKISPFEAVAATLPDESYDAVVTNVPFGDAGLREHAHKDDKLQSASLEAYFILRTMDKLKPGGLAAFITPPRIVSGTDAAMEDLRFKVSLRAEFLGAYRLPNKVFQDASDADTIVDIIAFRKHSRGAKQKIDELAAENIDVLRDKAVLWPEFLEGKYFRGEGLKFQLGEFKAKDPAKLRDVDRVISDEKDTAAIAKMIRKFPGSRIDWAGLDAEETAPILYQDGDVLYQDGQTLEYRAGKWLVREQDASSVNLAETGNQLTTALNAVNAGISFADAESWLRSMNVRAMGGDVPEWARKSIYAVAKQAVGERESWWQAVTAALAAKAVLEENFGAEPFHYNMAYPVLSARLLAVSHYGNRTIQAPDDIKGALKLLRVIVPRKGAFYARWLGNVKADVDMGDLTPEKAYEKIKYQSGDDFGYVPLDRLKTSQGEAFDPLNDDDWCLNPDGQSVMRAGDYYQGNYADFLKHSDEELKAAADPVIAAKILRQRQVAGERVAMPAIEKMTFTLNSPYLSQSQKLDFLRENVDPRFSLVPEMTTEGVEAINGKKEPVPTGRMLIDFPKISSAKETRRDQALRRFAVSYLKNGTITTGSKNDVVLANAEAESALIQEMREIVQSSNAKFNIWAKTNPDAFDSLKARLHDPANLFFPQVDDDSDLEIEGIGERKPHGYQNVSIRRYSRHFSGILGDDVGLGKSLQALLAVLHVQNIGAKRKTIFVVPNSVLSNWKRESAMAYASTDDCLYVGLTFDKAGKPIVDNKQRDRDIHAILENRHRKIFMTLEAFTSIPMREPTLEAYKSHIASTDPSFFEASEKKADEIRAAKKQQALMDTGKKSAALPYFEDMGVDSLVIDEAHMAKNSRLLSDFKSAKYLASSVASDRGLDMQIKCWFVRSHSANKDGVLALSATPITNSPLEIYSMLTLAVGEQELNRRLGIMGGDDFMNAFTDVQEQEEPDLIGRPRAGRVFLGLQNVTMLRTALQQIAIIRDKNDVGMAISVPEEDGVSTKVELDAESKRKLAYYKSIYEAARLMQKDEALPEQEQAVEAYCAQSGESVDLVAHPFNLINKMAKLIMDQELDKDGSFYQFSAAQGDAAKVAVGQFNNKNFKEKRDRPGLLTDPKNVSMKVRKDDNDNEKAEYTILVKAWIDGNQIVIDTDDHNTQSKFLEIADKAGLDLDVKISPKLAAMLENVKKELANPKAGRGTDAQGNPLPRLAKQIIFCDMLGMHNKIKLALKRVGIKPSQVAIVNAQAISDPADMQDVQDGFNAEHEENRYRVIIANKKAEVGINLQVGTQAIHHLSIGWTPDSLQQRNGRGVRQGNYLQRVTVYHYDANGSFDEYKRMLVGKKDDWIGKVIGKHGDVENIQIGGELSEKEMHDLIMSSGDAGAMEKAREQIERRERERMRDAARGNQVQILRIIEGQNNWLKNHADATAYRNAKIFEYLDLTWQAEELAAKIGRSTSERVIATLKKQKADVDARAATLGGLLEGSSFVPAGQYDYQGNGHAKVDTPISGKGYKLQEYGRDKGQPQFRGKLNPDSALGQRYAAERAGKGKALQQARDDYKGQAARQGAYSDSTLKAFETGEGKIIGGVLLMQGMVGIHKGEYWIAETPSKLVLPIDGRSMPSGAAVSGFEFVGPADADEDWLPVATNLARVDEQTIAQNKADGFEIGDKRLYSTCSPEIAALVKLVPTGKLAYPNNLYLKAPLFRFPINPEQATTPLLKAIVAQQAEAIEWKHETDQWERKTSRVRALNIHKVEPEGVRYDGRSAALITFAIANGLKVGYDDFEYFLEGNRSFTILIDSKPGFQKQFDSGLADAVAEAKTGDDLTLWADGFVRAAFDFVAFDEVMTPLSLMGVGLKARLGRAVETLKAGGKPVIWLDEVLATGAAFYVADLVGRALAERAGDFVKDGTVVDRGTIREAALAEITAEPFDGFAGAFVVPASVRDVALSNYYGPKPDGAILLARAEAAITALWNRHITTVCIPVENAARAINVAKHSSGYGMDYEALLQAIYDKAKLDGFAGGKISTETITGAARSGSKGAYAFRAGHSLAVETKYKSAASEKVQTIKTRFWAKEEAVWLFALKPGEKDSKGGEIASVIDLCRAFGIDPGEFKNSED